MSTIWFKRQRRTEEKRKKLDDLKCSPGSDIESQDLFNNVIVHILQGQIFK